MSLKNNFFGIYHPVHKSALLCLDLAAFAGAFVLATQYRLKSNPDFLSLEFLGLTVIVL